jgi:hypothetical protein
MSRIARWYSASSRFSILFDTKQPINLQHQRFRNSDACTTGC